MSSDGKDPAPNGIKDVTVHPLVLLSVVDHYNRVARDTSARVVGVLLGEEHKGQVDVTNCFAVPFEEDRKNPNVWYLDHSYMETMFVMFRKVNVKEKIVGFYSSGPKIRPADIHIDGLFRKYADPSVFVIVDVREDLDEVPTQAYTSVEVVEEGKATRRAFQHVPCEVAGSEVEEIGVEHLLRDVNDPSVSHLGAAMRMKRSGLKGLASKLKQIVSYLDSVLGGELPMNHQILYNVQTILNLLPNLGVDSLRKAMLVQTNDFYLVMYVSALIRAVMSLHDLVSNKLQFKDGAWSAPAKKAEEAEESKEGEKTAGDGSGSSDGSGAKK
jgi:26S proteasome regulatory subunit N8